MRAPWTPPLRAVTAIVLTQWLAGCSTANQQIYMEPTSVQTVEYYPFQVKGYQKTYLKRAIVVAAVIDARDFKDLSGVSHEPDNGHPAIGLIRDQSGKIDQRLYGPPLEPLVQKAIAEAASEAGMISTSTSLPLKQALAARNADYILEAKITRFWVSKHRGSDNQAGPTWFAAAEVTLETTIYKPPFDVPFWQGESAANYSDPEAPAAGSAPEDQTEIYDQPGQVLSVALTRAVAGIFKRDNLRTLIAEDSQSAH
jgi:hypothetical protein